jgi:hypothetical protein
MEITQPRPLPSLGFKSNLAFYTHQLGLTTPKLMTQDIEVVGFNKFIF